MIPSKVFSDKCVFDTDEHIQGRQAMLAQLQKQVVEIRDRIDALYVKAEDVSFILRVLKHEA